MNKSAGGGALSKPIPVASPGSRTTSTISSLEFEDDDQSEESSWATYTDDLDRQQQNKIFVSNSLFGEEYATDLGAPWGASDKKVHDQCRKNMLKNRMIVNMKKGGSPSSVVDKDLEDTASSPHNSPTVSYMNQLNMMKLRTNSTAQEKMGKVAGITDLNSKKESTATELEKRGLCLVPLSSMAFDLDKV